MKGGRGQAALRDGIYLVVQEDVLVELKQALDEINLTQDLVDWGCKVLGCRRAY